MFSFKAEDEPQDDTSDPWGSVFVDVVTWLTTSRTCLVAGAAALGLGAYSAIIQTTRTTYFCSSVHDNAGRDFGLQFVGLALDAVILVLLWRVLWWAQSTQARLHSLFTILRDFLLPGSLILIASVIFGRSSIRFIHMSDAFADGLLLSTLLIASAFLMCESTPLTPLSIITVTYGLTASLQNVDRMKTWLHGTAPQAFLPLYLLCFGYFLILSRNHTHMLSTGLRVFIFFAMTATIFSCLPIALLRGKDQKMVPHPLHNLIYKARIESDRWLTKVSVSDSLRIAVAEYKERNGGRNPPPGFDAWYEFARSKKSVIIDDFGQISKDISSFWEVPPETLRSRIGLLSEQPGIGMVQIRSGAVSTESVKDDPDAWVLQGLVAMISEFSKHLPDMDIPVNLFDHPRVLSSHDGAPMSRVSSLPERRHMQSLACPPSSAVGSGQPVQLRDISLTSFKPYSKGQFITSWEKALSTCDQPDIPYLHGFHTSPPPLRTLNTHLVPLFSRAKTSGFADILIPFLDEQRGSEDPFDSKRNALYWRGGYGDVTAGPQSLRGNHKHRLAHMVNNATEADETVVALPGKGNKFRYAPVKTRNLNKLLPMDVGFTTDPAAHACSGRDCAAAFSEFGAEEGGDALESRYALLLDADSGPASSPGILASLRSTSVPFVSTIFTEWFTERIHPWVHFVPIDVRYTDLHSTLTYFTGLRSEEAREEGNVEVTLEGKDAVVEGAVGDARWIASQGRTWAGTALRREDMEVYLFRLLLEWGRVMDDEREGLGFVYEGG